MYTVQSKFFASRLRSLRLKWRGIAVCVLELEKLDAEGDAVVVVAVVVVVISLVVVISPMNRRSMRPVSS